MELPEVPEAPEELDLEFELGFEKIGFELNVIEFLERSWVFGPQIRRYYEISKNKPFIKNILKFLEEFSEKLHEEGNLTAQLDAVRSVGAFLNSPLSTRRALILYRSVMKKLEEYAKEENAARKIKEFLLTFELPRIDFSKIALALGKGEEVSYKNYQAQIDEKIEKIAERLLTDHAEKFLAAEFYAFFKGISKEELESTDPLLVYSLFYESPAPAFYTSVLVKFLEEVKKRNKKEINEIFESLGLIHGIKDAVYGEEKFPVKDWETAKGFALLMLEKYSVGKSFYFGDEWEFTVGRDEKGKYVVVKRRYVKKVLEKKPCFLVVLKKGEKYLKIYEEVEKIDESHIEKRYQELASEFKNAKLIKLILKPVEISTGVVEEERKFYEGSFEEWLESYSERQEMLINKLENEIKLCSRLISYAKNYLFHMYAWNTSELGSYSKFAREVSDFLERKKTEFLDFVSRTGYLV